jgi:threonylcarbamoyladenosine tRNA methylthiotransferase MtaB
MSESQIPNPRIAHRQAQPPTVAVMSLGCRANQEEIECLLGNLGDRGFKQVPFGQAADWVILNTCSVTGAGESDARQAIRRAIRSVGSGKVVVTGCFAQRDPGAISKMGAHLVVGNADKWRLPGILLGEGSGDPQSVANEILHRQDPTASQFLRHGLRASGYRTRAAIKVQDGCDEHCTYCIIPMLRGRSVSRPVNQVLDEARVLVASGFSEITLTGIHTASYTANGVRLSGLLRKLLDVRGLRRIRVNSLEPQWVDRELIGTLASSDRFCRHVHLPLQSGDDRVLKRMGRGYSANDYRTIVSAIRDEIPGVAIGADVLAGFPGEGPDAADRTVALLEDVRPAYLHVFPYSPRPGTSSEKLGLSVPVAIKLARSARLRLLDSVLRREFLVSSEGQVHEILVEDKRGQDGLFQAMTDTAIRVAVAASTQAGLWINVRLRATGSHRFMLGDPA